MYEQIETGKKKAIKLTGETEELQTHCEKWNGESRDWKKKKGQCHWSVGWFKCNSSVPGTHKQRRKKEQQHNLKKQWLKFSWIWWKL